MPLRRDPTIPLPQQRNNSTTPPSQPITFQQEASAFNNFATQYVADKINFTGDWESFLTEAKPGLLNLMRNKRNNKVKLVIECKMHKQNGDVLETKTKRFITKENKIITEDTDLDALYEEMMDELNEKIGDPENEDGSGWIFDSIESISLHTVEWEPLGGSSYIPLPKEIKSKGAVINMKNQDKECFAWSILRAKNPTNTHPERIDTNLKNKKDNLNMKGIKCPVELKDINRFEKQNPDISVIVFGFDVKKKNFYPLRISKHAYKRKLNVNLLLIEEDGETHYCLIKNLSRLLSSQCSSHRCLNSFWSKKSLEKHLESCENHDAVKIEMPKAKTILKFENYYHGKKLLFTCYADMECTNSTIDSCDPNPQESFTKKVQKHNPNSFVYYIICDDDSICEPIIRGYTKTKPDDPDPMDMFIKYLQEDLIAIAKIPKAKPILTEEDEKHFNKAKECRMCNEAFKDEDNKIRDHCYYTGKYWGATHKKCCLKRQTFIPIIFHNLSGYDSHLFIKNLTTYDENENISVIPNNQEKYISFTKTITTGKYYDYKTKKYKTSTFQLRFIDSFKFMGTSLQALVNNLPDEAFKNLGRYYQGEN